MILIIYIILLKGVFSISAQLESFFEWVSSNYDGAYNSSKLKSHGLNEFGKKLFLFAKIIMCC